MNSPSRTPEGTPIRDMTRAQLETFGSGLDGEMIEYSDAMVEVFWLIALIKRAARAQYAAGCEQDAADLYSWLEEQKAVQRQHTNDILAQTEKLRELVRQRATEAQEAESLAEDEPQTPSRSVTSFLRDIGNSHLVTRQEGTPQVGTAPTPIRAPKGTPDADMTRDQLITFEIDVHQEQLEDLNRLEADLKANASERAAGLKDHYSKQEATHSKLEATRSELRADLKQIMALKTETRKAIAEQKKSSQQPVEGRKINFEDSLITSIGSPVIVDEDERKHSANDLSSDNEERKLPAKVTSSAEDESESNSSDNGGDDDGDENPDGNESQTARPIRRSARNKKN